MRCYETVPEELQGMTMHRANAHLGMICCLCVYFFPWPFTPSADTDSPSGDFQGDDNFLTSKSLQVHLNTPSPLHFVTLLLLCGCILQKDLYSWMSCKHQHGCKYTVTDSVHILIYLTSSLFVSGWLRLEWNLVSHGCLCKHRWDKWFFLKRAWDKLTLRRLLDYNAHSLPTY